MDFIQTLKNCQNAYATLQLIKQEYHDDLLNNLQSLLNLWINYDINTLLDKIYKSDIFTQNEFKTILFGVINHLKKERLSPMTIIYKYGSFIIYDKNDLKELFLIIIHSNIENKLISQYTEAISINRKMYDAVFNNDKLTESNLQKEMLLLIGNHIQKWNAEVSKDEIVQLISFNCKHETFEKIFVDRVMGQINVTINEIVTRIVEEQFIDGMQLIGAGSYSMVFKKDERIIKISFRGEEYKNYNSHSILKFDSIETETLENGTLLFTIGFQSLANAKWYDGLSKEEINLKMYRVFCDIKDDGYIITDIKKENFGILNNKLVVIDSGYIYDEDTFDINQISNSVPIFTKSIFEYFMKLYKDGYRVDDKNNLTKLAR